MVQEWLATDVDFQELFHPERQTQHPVTVQHLRNVQLQQDIARLLVFVIGTLNQNETYLKACLRAIYANPVCDATAASHGLTRVSDFLERFPGTKTLKIASMIKHILWVPERSNDNDNDDDDNNDDDDALSLFCMYIYSTGIPRVLDAENFEAPNYGTEILGIHGNSTDTARVCP